MGKRNIQIVPGDGNIEISPAEDHINDIVDNDRKKPKSHAYEIRLSKQELCPSSGLL